MKLTNKNVYFYQFSLDIISPETAYTLTNQDFSISGLDALFVQEFNSVHAIVDEPSRIDCCG